MLPFSGDMSTLWMRGRYRYFVTYETSIATILRTVDAWWTSTPSGAVPIDTDAATTGELLAAPERIEDARAGADVVPVESLELVSPVTAPCPPLKLRR